MRTILTFLCCLFLVLPGKAQQGNQHIENGNQDYKHKEFKKADEQYTKALQKDQKSTVAQFNSGNAKQKLNRFDEAAKAYEAAASNTTDPLVKAKAYYNQGLSFIRQNKLKEAIDAFKQSLRYNADDKEARENLQKALKEKKQQEQPKNNNNPNNKNNNKPKEKDQPKPPRSNLKKEDAEKMLNNLQREEKNLQKQLQSKKQSGRQLKDW